MRSICSWMFVLCRTASKFWMNLRGTRPSSDKSSTAFRCQVKPHGLNKSVYNTYIHDIYIYRIIYVYLQMLRLPISLYYFSIL